MCCHLVVVEGLACLNDLQGHAGQGYPFRIGLEGEAGRRAAQPSELVCTEPLGEAILCVSLCLAEHMADESVLVGVKAIL